MRDGRQVPTPKDGSRHVDVRSLAQEDPSFPIFVSAARPDAFAAACTAGTDIVVIDLEDSVAPESKVAVRRIPQSAIPADRSFRLFLRVNGVGTVWHRDDVAFARMSGADGVVLPKSESAEQITELRAALGPGQKVFALIETVRGLSRADEIAAASDRLVFGSIDLSEDMGCAHGRLALLPLASRIVQAARLAGRPAPLDGVTVTVTDAAAIADDARHASDLGFGGKCLIHPRQLAPARAGFGTPPQDLDWARHALAADDGSPPEAEGEILSSPVVARARRIMLRGQARMTAAAEATPHPEGQNESEARMSDQTETEPQDPVGTLKARLKLPLIGAPMFLASGPDLVVAQCKAGIVGSFPALNARPADQLDLWLTDIEDRLEAHRKESGVTPAPFGVNLIVNDYNSRLDEDLATVVRHEVPLVITSLSAPDKVVEAVHGYGGLVFHDVVKARHARRAVAAGVDGLILVCSGAGGHGGTLNPFALVEEVRDFYDGPLVLSGAIANGRAILAAEVLGCDFAYAGTVFIPSQEAIAPQAHKEMIVAAQSDHILYTPLFSGTHANYLVPSIEAAGVDLDEARLAQPRRMVGKSDPDRPKAWSQVWSAGQAVAQSRALEPAAKIVARLEREYRVARAALCGGEGDPR
ncbi:aldolase/citrate lyase family protein [Sulfitobacter sp. LCG007]